MTLKHMFGVKKSLLDQVEQDRERLYRVALSWCHDEMLSEDLVQETLIIGMQKIGDLRDINFLTSWLFSILNNQWRLHLRKFKPYLDIDEMVLESDSSPENECDQHQKSDNIRMAMGKLPLMQRQVIALVDLEEFSYNDVSQILEIPIGTVMSRLSRARKKLIFLLTNKKTFQSKPYLRSVK